MIVSTINNPETVILIVHPCTCVDIETSEALALAREADPDLSRTMIVLTKPDQCSPGDAGPALMILKSTGEEEHATLLGSVVVRNRTPEEIRRGMTLAQVRKMEKSFFENHRDFVGLPSDQCGMDSLCWRLTSLLVARTRELLPSIYEKLHVKLEKARADLKEVGVTHDTSTPGAARRSLMALVRQVDHQLEAMVRGGTPLASERVAQHLSQSRDKLRAIHVELPPEKRKQLLDEDKERDKEEDRTIWSLILHHEKAFEQAIWSTRPQVVRAISKQFEVGDEVRLSDGRQGRVVRVLRHGRKGIVVRIPCDAAAAEDIEWERRSGAGAGAGAGADDVEDDEEDVIDIAVNLGDVECIDADVLLNDLSRELEAHATSHLPTLLPVAPLERRMRVELHKMEEQALKHLEPVSLVMKAFCLTAVRELTMSTPKLEFVLGRLIIELQKALYEEARTRVQADFAMQRDLLHGRIEALAEAAKKEEVQDGGNADLEEKLRETLRNDYEILEAGTCSSTDWSGVLSRYLDELELRRKRDAESYNARRLARELASFWRYTSEEVVNQVPRLARWFLVSEMHKALRIAVLDLAESLTSTLLEEQQPRSAPSTRGVGRASASRGPAEDALPSTYKSPGEVASPGWPGIVKELKAKVQSEGADGGVLDARGLAQVLLEERMDLAQMRRKLENIIARTTAALDELDALDLEAHLAVDASCLCTSPGCSRS